MLLLEPIGNRFFASWYRCVAVLHCFEMVEALAAAGRFPRRLDGRQQQRDQDPDDRNHNQQFNQREAAPGILHRFALKIR